VDVHAARRDPSGLNGRRLRVANMAPQVLVSVFAVGRTRHAGQGPGFQAPESRSAISCAPCKAHADYATAAATFSRISGMITTYRTRSTPTARMAPSSPKIAARKLQWFNADSNVSTRQAFTRTLTTDTDGHHRLQDAPTVTVVKHPIPSRAGKV